MSNSVRVIEPEQNQMYRDALKIVDQYLPNWNYEIPNEHEKDTAYFMGLSGGVDSAVLGLVMALKHPNINFYYLFTDTGVEPKECFTLLDHMETLLNIKVIRIKDGDLVELINSNGYLPSPRTRWCTAKLKIKPWENYIKENFLKKYATVVTFAGIRFDERDRAGAVPINNVITAHPFVNQKVNREIVCRIGAQLGLINSSYYRGRSRSGCFCCFFMSKQELVSLHEWDAKSFKIARELEKIDDDLLERLDSDITFPVSNYGFYTLYPRSHLLTNGKNTLEVNNIFGSVERTDVVGKIQWDYEPVTIQQPKKLKVKEKISSDEQVDMFGFLDDENIEIHDDLDITYLNKEATIEEREVTLFVAIEHYQNTLATMLGGDGVWQSRLVTYSTTTAGLTKALHGYSYHRSMAAFTAWSSIEHYEEESHITVISINFPKGIIPKINYGKNYGWVQGRSYAEVSQNIRWIQRACEIFQSNKIIKDAQISGRKTRLVQDAEKTIKNYKKIGSPNVGTITGIGHYRPKPIENRLDDSYDEQLTTVRCAICSL